MRCARDPEVETNLTCGRCGTPICPKCLVQTPVGARCLKCADLKRLPTFEITNGQYLKAIVVGLALSVIVGISWGWLRDIVSSLFFGLQFSVLWGIPVGYVIGELLSLSVNRKRGRVLQVISAIVVILSYIVSRAEFSAGVYLVFPHFILWDLLGIALGIYIAISRLR